MTFITIGNIPAETLLGMQIDLNTKLRGGALTIHQLELFLKRQNPFAFPKSIKLGTHRDTREINESMRTRGAEIEDTAWLSIHMPSFWLAKKEIEVQIANVSARDLGFTDWARRDEIFARATSPQFGYVICPPEVGPQLRLQYLDQPKGESVYIAMEAIEVQPSNPVVFQVRNNSGRLVIQARDGRADRDWPLDTRWVFIKPDNTTSPH